MNQYPFWQSILLCLGAPRQFWLLSALKRQSEGLGTQAGGSVVMVKWSIRGSATLDHSSCQGKTTRNSHHSGDSIMFSQRPQKGTGSSCLLQEELFRNDSISEQRPLIPVLQSEPLNKTAAQLWWEERMWRRSRWEEEVWGTKRAFPKRWNVDPKGSATLLHPSVFCPDAKMHPFSKQRSISKTHFNMEDIPGNFFWEFSSEFGDAKLLIIHTLPRVDCTLYGPIQCKIKRWDSLLKTLSTPKYKTLNTPKYKTFPFIDSASTGHGIYWLFNIALQRSADPDLP